MDGWNNDMTIRVLQMAKRYADKSSSLNVSQVIFTV